MAKIPEHGQRHKLDDATLVRRIREGDQEAVKILFGKYKPTIQLVVDRRITSPDDRKDVVQNTWIALWKNARNGKIDFEKAGKDLGGYVYTIAQWQLSQYFRQERRESPPNKVGIDDLDAFSLYSEIKPEYQEILPVPPDAKINNKLYESILTACLKKLPALHQTIIHLLEDKGLDIKEIGEKLNLSPRQVRDKCYFANKKMTKCVQKKCKKLKIYFT